jgi:hypothetical protein
MNLGHPFRITAVTRSGCSVIQAAAAAAAAASSTEEEEGGGGGRGAEGEMVVVATVVAPKGYMAEARVAMAGVEEVGRKVAGVVGEVRRG